MIIKRALLLVILANAQAISAPADHPVRTWTSVDGKTLEASLVQADRSVVILKLRNGHEATVPLERLSEPDRRHLEELRSTGRNLRVGAMPEESRIDATVSTEGGPKTYTTPNFTFDCETEVTKAFIGEAARVFEGTLEAVRSLPLGLDPKPAAGETRFRTRFLERNTFDSEYRRILKEDSPPSTPATSPIPGGTGTFTPVPFTGTAYVGNVAGVYLPRRKEVLVPYSSLGVNMSGSKVSLRKSSDTSTLIHEVTHQVMHDWLLVTPLWVGEGLAEYLSAVPYQNGRFEFKNAATGLKETLLQDYGIKEGETVGIFRPHLLITSTNASWTGAPGDYLSAMMVIYYFIHLDQPEKPCASIAAYLGLLKDAQSETEKFIGEYNRVLKEFEETRLAYNREVDAFNAALAAFKAEVDAYNERVRTYNTQVGKGVPVDQRIEVGKVPDQPMPPKELAVPEILKKNAGARPTDFLAKIKESALPALLRGRDGETLDEALVAAYGAMGIKVELSDSRATRKVNLPFAPPLPVNP